MNKPKKDRPYFDRIFRDFVFLAFLFAVGGMIYLFRDEIAVFWQLVKNGQTNTPVFFAAFLVLPVLGFPIVPLLALLGIRYGVVWGIIIMFCLIPVHLAAAYLATRTRLFKYLQKMAFRISPKMVDLPQKQRLKFGLAFMFIPGLSYAMKNYLLPVTGISFGSYLICGWLPQGIMGIPFVVAGHAAMSWSSVALAGLCLFLTVVFILKKTLSRLYKKIFRITHSNTETDSALKEDST